MPSGRCGMAMGVEARVAVGIAVAVAMGAVARVAVGIAVAAVAAGIAVAGIAAAASRAVAMAVATRRTSGPGAVARAAEAVFSAHPICAAEACLTSSLSCFLIASGTNFHAAIEHIS